MATKKGSIKKKAPVKKAKKAAPKKKPAPAKKIKSVGTVTHYYAHIKVAIIKFNTKIKAGTELYFKGATTDFKEAAKSMQFDHKPVAAAMPKKQIGLKLKKRVREGDLVYTS